MNKILAIAKQAGKIIEDIYRQNNFAIEYKADSSPVTKADIASHKFITRELTKLNPSYPVLSEEESVSYSERRRWDKYWLVDPLDGTKEFIGKTDEFTVNIALIEHHKPILGVVFAPILKQMYWAEVGGKAMYQLGEKEPEIIRVNNNRDPIVTVSRRHGSKEKMQQLLRKIGKHQMLLCGSSLKICLVASGQADIYPRFGPTSEWDTAAGQCILAAAGGGLTDFMGNALSYNQKDSLINPEFVAINNVKIIFDIFCG